MYWDGPRGRDREPGGLVTSAYSVSEHVGEASATCSGSDSSLQATGVGAVLVSSDGVGGSGTT